MKERVQYLDTLRVFACTLVVLTHCIPPLYSSDRSSIHSFVSFICSCSPELFFAISGALLLPVRMSTKEFIKKRFMRVFPPLMFWSCVIVIYNYLSHSASLDETLKSFISIPIKPVIGVYWFFYVIAGLYLFAPIISKWMVSTSKKEIHLFLFLWGLTLIFASLNIFFDGRFIPVNGNYYFILNSFGGFLGYMILGNYLHNHTAVRTVKNNVLIPLVILFALFLFAVVGYKLQIVTVGFFINNLSISVALMTYSFFMLFKDLKFNNKTIIKIISDIAVCSFGIYLIHIFIARSVVWELLNYTGISNFPIIIVTIISLVLSMCISYGVVKLIKLLPYSKYIVG